MQAELESEEQSGELGAVAAALDQVYAEQDEGIGPAAAALTAIVPTRKGVELSALLAANKALDVVRAGMKADTSSLTLGVTDALRQQMTAPMGVLPRLMLGDSAIESLRRASMGPTITEIMTEMAESITLASGITDGISVWRNTFDSIGKSAIESIQGAGIFSDVAESFNSICGINRWQDSLASIKLPSSDLPQIMSGISAWQENSLNEQLSLFSAAQKEREETYTKLLGEAAQRWAAEQQQREKAMSAAFADIGRWQGPSILWREAVHSAYELAPEPPTKQIEVVQIDDEITLESLSAALAEGRLPWREVLQLAMQHMPSTKPGRKEPPIPEQLALVEGWYAIRGSKRDRRGIKGLDTLQQGYCDKVHISRSTLNRYERNCKALGLI